MRLSYPNPTAGRATLSYYLPVDALGRWVAALAPAGSQAAALRTLAVLARPAGLYTVRLTVGGVTAHRQLVVE